MSFFSSPSYSIRNIKDDRERGRAVLQIFFNESKSNFPAIFKGTFEEFISVIDNKSKGFISGLGLGVSYANATDSKLRDSMKNLAFTSKGGIPKNLSVITQSISQSIQKFEIEDFEKVAIKTYQDTKDNAKVALAGYGTYKILSLAIPVIIYFLSRNKKA